MWDYGEDNRGPLMAEVAIGMAIMCLVAVALRSYTMATILKRFVVEDYLAVLTCLLQCGFSAVVVVGVSYGLGAHVEYVSVANRHKALIYKWAGQVAYIVVSTLVKFVVGIFLLRLCVNNNWQRITIIVLLCVVGLFNAFYVFVAIFQCQPVAFYWYRYTENAPVTGRCNGRLLATIPTYFAVLIGLVSDLVLALLPITLIKGAKLDKRTKISVCCVLALGSLASVATIARIPYASQLLSNPDYLYNFTDLAIWSIVECGIAITASSLATLRPLFIQMKVLTTGHFTSRYGGRSRAASDGLPMQSLNSVTVISSHGRGMMPSKRSTVLTGSTAVSFSRRPSQAKENKDTCMEKGIKVDTEFDLTIITKESSIDSIDRLEAEVNEVIHPGATARKLSYDQTHPPRKSSLSLRPPLPLLHTYFQADSTLLSEEAVTTSSPLARSSSLLQTRRRPSEGPPPPPPSFHLPTRLHHGHQSTLSDQSGSVRFDLHNNNNNNNNNTHQGLSAPPRVSPLNGAPASHTTPSPSESSTLGAPISLSGHHAPRRPSASSSPSSPQLPTAAAAGSRQPPFQQWQNHTGQAVPETTPRRGGKSRVSAFIAAAAEEGDDNEPEKESSQQQQAVVVHFEDQEEEKQPGTPPWTWPEAAPEVSSSVPSPLRRNPPNRWL